jgi:hypothetical protein
VERKILYSPGYGAGWVSWHGGTKEEKEFMFGYQPFIEALENNKKIDDAMCKQFEQDWEVAFPGVDPPYFGGCHKLCVKTVSGQFQLREYDGSESIVLAGQEEWF